MAKKKKRRASGEGCIIELPDGRFAAKLRLGYDEAGKPIVLKKEAKTERECTEWLTGMRYSRQRGVSLAPTKTTVAQLLARWMTDVVVRRVKPKTLAHYEAMVKHLTKGTLAEVPINKLTTQQIQTFLNAKLDQRDENGKPRFSPKTVKHVRDTLRAALNVAVDEWDLLPKNPAKKASPGRIPKPGIRTFSVEQARKFVEAVRDHRWEALFTVAVALGLRRGEALGLRWSDFDPEKRLLRIEKSLDFLKGAFIHGDVKTDSSRKVMPLLPFAVSALVSRRLAQECERLAAKDAWTGNERHLIFTTSVGTPIMPRNFQRAFDGVLKKANLPKIRLHDLRHSAGTILIAQGLPLALVSKYLRHANISTTVDWYSHLSAEDLSPVTAAMERILTGSNVDLDAVSKAESTVVGTVTVQ